MENTKDIEEIKKELGLVFLGDGSVTVKLYRRKFRFMMGDIILRESFYGYEFAAIHYCPVVTKYTWDDIRAYVTLHKSADLARPSRYTFNGRVDKILKIIEVDFNC